MPTKFSPFHPLPLLGAILAAPSWLQTQRKPHSRLPTEGRIALLLPHPRLNTPFLTVAGLLLKTPNTLASQFPAAARTDVHQVFTAHEPLEGALSHTFSSLRSTGQGYQYPHFRRKNSEPSTHKHAHTHHTAPRVTASIHLRVCCFLSQLS